MAPDEERLLGPVKGEVLSRANGGRFDGSVLGPRYLILALNVLAVGVTQLRFIAIVLKLSALCNNAGMLS